MSILYFSIESESISYNYVNSFECQFKMQYSDKDEISEKYEVGGEKNARNFKTRNYSFECCFLNLSSTYAKS